MRQLALQPVMARNKFLAPTYLHWLLICFCNSTNSQKLKFGASNLLCPDNTTTVKGYTNTSSGYILGSVRLIVEEAFSGDEDRKLFFNTSGSYFLPCPFNGMLSEINALGHLLKGHRQLLVNGDAESNPDVPASKSNAFAYSYGLIYRPNAETSMYRLYYGPVRMTHQFDFNPIFPNVSVRKGDLIGILIPEECTTLPEKDHHTACPSHPNLKVKEGKCSSAFFHSMDNIDTLPENIPVDDFDEVLVDLNMEAVISSPSQNGYTVLLAVCLTMTTIVLLVVIVLMVAIIIRARRGWTFKKKIHSSRLSHRRGSFFGSSRRFERQPAKLSTLTYRVAPDQEGSATNLDSGYRAASVDNTTCDNGALFQLSKFDAYLFKVKKAWIPFHQLQTEEEIGKGAFGCVFKGLLTQKLGTVVKVAVKTVKSTTGSYAELKGFIDECRLMCSFNHPHVLGLVGISLDSNNSPYLLLPYMENGDLKSFLQKNRTDGLPEDMFLRICKEIAKGMEYLASKRLVHRDLAARNCMVDEAQNVKVGDFGLTRDIYETDYYRLNHTTRMPIKWMAPESMSDRISNEKTDVWSFGVTCWEVYSMGKTPYPTISNIDMAQYLEQGHRLKQPVFCSHSVFSLIKRCWEENPEIRPTFTEIVEMLISTPALQQEARFDTEICSIQPVELSCATPLD